MAALAHLGGLLLVFVILPFTFIALYIGAATVLVLALEKFGRRDKSGDLAGDPPSTPVFDGKSGPRAILAKLGPNRTAGD
ncbi:MAG: hypothetical protein QGF33_11225 [Alphaproteobacteria bacterium]|nr:hypothetical protein [Alphaproteobacteria bacterium]